MESKLEVGVPSGKLSCPPKNCIPSRAKMKMNRKRSNKRDIIEDKAFIRAITRFLNGDQYLEINEGWLDICRYIAKIAIAIESNVQIVREMYLGSRPLYLH